LVFAAGMTIYILVGIQFEERDLVIELPDYQQYQRKVPMLVPSSRKRLLQEPDGDREVSLPRL
jgi:protein-S-isoprenylcysteine O-methyltransferase Ste14